MIDNGVAAHILIVEDNPKNLKLIRDLLRVTGYTTLEAGDGETAIGLARQQQPGLILMDVQLPGLDGVSAMKALKQDDTTRHIPIVALTAFAMKDDDKKFLAQGFDGYLSKPIDIEQTLKMVRDFVG
jgi:two-component system cell cycle response regulator DivK